jgi:hypothetical protein
MHVVRKPLSEPPGPWQPERVPSVRDTRPDFPVPGIPWRGRARQAVDRVLAMFGLQLLR